MEVMPNAMPRLARALRRGVRAVVDLALPPRSLAAIDGAAVFVQAPGLDAERWRRIVFIDAPFCEACGIPFEYHLGEGALCALCQSRERAFNRLRAACLYDENSRGLILALKHGDRTDLSGLFAAWLARAAADVLPHAEGILPVPMHPWRLLSRRFNQAAEIARPLARLARAPYIADALVRSRRTPSQGSKSASGRRRNVAGAFAVSPRWRARISGRRLLLVDDVFTTGATVEGCARALKAAGAIAVDVAVIARVGVTTPRDS
jgi:ComF family protein